MCIRDSNGVGGPSATNIARYLADDGVLVTYGGMSKKPVQLPTSLLIFKNIQARGFWLSNWLQSKDSSERMGMVKKLWDLVRDKKLRLWMERYVFKTDFQAALKRNGEPYRARKVVLVMKPHKHVVRFDD
eukprot:TRINITY_DN6184_c0_g2_i2.p1 TRINITY_DN6184_c0_g2~~TRINITY_DN6184_c0_g2_i2.p1  ORF type:complete len:130 (+),score=29.72 TRINITY_DN6184_c0_g2_i2:34-423(+)